MPRIVYHHLASAGYFGLFLLRMAWFTLLFPSPAFPTALGLLLTVGPLLLPLRGFLRRNLKSCTWMSYLSLPYFIHAVIALYADAAERPYAALECLTSLMLCFGAGFYVYRAPKT